MSNQIKKNGNQIGFIDLFCGIGGFRGAACGAERSVYLLYLQKKFS